MSFDHVATPKTRPLPIELESPSAKLIYLYLQTERGATIDDIHDALGMAHISLYPILRKLSQRGFVELDGSRYRCLD